MNAPLSFSAMALRHVELISAKMIRTRRHVHAAAGFTLIELMVAMTIGLVVVLAAVAALTMSRQGFAGLDSASQLRDNGRFALDFVQRLAVQAGFVDSPNLNARNVFQANASQLLPPIFGYDNKLPDHDKWGNDSNTTVACAASTACGDVLILSNQFSADLPNSSAVNAPGQAMLNCFGASPKASDTVFRSALYIAPNATTAEPTLMCKYTSDGTWVKAPQPLVDGVESFQVLYGVNGVTPNTSSAAASLSSDQSVPTRYLRADELTVGSSVTSAATINNWRRVRTLRIGMVLRGPVGSAPVARTGPLYPLGQELGSIADVGSIVEATSINDTRLRTVLTFTVQLRNYQGGV